MAGGKGGSQTSSVEIPEYIEKAAQRNLNKAERISQLGYVPYYGPDVAAFTPMQQAAMQWQAWLARLVWRHLKGRIFTVCLRN